MTDEEIKSLEYNGVMVNDASDIINELIADLRKARKERDWLAETCATVLSEITKKLTQKGLDLKYPPTKEEILEEAREVTK